MDQLKQRSLEKLRELLKALPKGPRDSLKTWMSAYKVNFDSSVDGYEHIYRAKLPIRGRKAPSMVKRELKTLGRVMKELHRRMEGLSNPARSWIASTCGGVSVDQTRPEWVEGHGSDWFCLLHPSLFDASGKLKREEDAPKPPWLDLPYLVDFITKVTDPNSHAWEPTWWLLVTVATAMEFMKRPKTHVLPVAGVIHTWVTGEPVSPEWGKAYLARLNSP
jgi:hypothetical protein